MSEHVSIKIIRTAVISTSRLCGQQVKEAVGSAKDKVNINKVSKVNINKVNINKAIKVNINRVNIINVSINKATEVNINKVR